VLYKANPEEGGKSIVIVEVYKKDQSAVLQGGQQMMIRMVGVLFCVQLSQFDKWYNSSSSSAN